MTRPPPPPLPLRADERTTLTSFLDFCRAAVVDRAYGLSDAQLRTPHPPSSLSLARLLGHLALVEHHWFRHRFAGQPMPDPWHDLDFDADRDAEMTLAETWTRPELLARFDEAVTDSRAWVAAAPSLDALSVESNPDGEHWSLRWILVHMIEEYARHCGHADLIREAIDGDVLS